MYYFHERYKGDTVYLAPKGKGTKAQWQVWPQQQVLKMIRSGTGPLLEDAARWEAQRRLQCIASVIPLKQLHRHRHLKAPVKSFKAADASQTGVSTAREMSRGSEIRH